MQIADWLTADCGLRIYCGLRISGLRIADCGFSGLMGFNNRTNRQSTINNQQSAIGQSKIDNPQSANQQSAINPQSTIRNPQQSICNLQSAFCNVL
jgi:hypothetical protein